MTLKNWLRKINRQLHNTDDILLILLAFLGVMATIAAAFYGASLGSQGAQDLWKKQTNDTKENVAKMLFFEIYSHQSSYKDLADMYKKEKYEFKENGTLYAHKVIYDKIYPEYFLYDSFKSEIASFDPKLSQYLYDYYKDLWWAEEYRKQLLEYPRFNSTDYRPRGTEGYSCDNVKQDPLTKNIAPSDDEDCMILYAYADPNRSFEENLDTYAMQMASNRLRNRVIAASNRTPEILELLKKEYHDSQ